MTGGNIEEMLYSECGAEIQSTQSPQLGEDFLPAMYLYHDVIICNNFIMVASIQS